MFRIVQLSDLHCGQQFFLPQHLERAIAEVNEMQPDVVVISGDLTSNGFKDEYVLAREYLNRVECKAMVVIPGNHDSRNVGYVHFEDLFGDRNSVLQVGDAGTVSSSRLRGNGRPSYNVVECEGTHIDVWRRYPFHGQERIIQFSTDTKTYEKYTARIEDEVRST